MDTIVKRNSSTINWLQDVTRDRYNLYIDDFLISVEGKELTDLDILNGLQDFAERHGWRDTVANIKLYDTPARNILKANLPDYLHPIIPEFMEQLVEACDDNVVYTENSIVGDFMTYAKHVGSLNPMQTVRTMAPSPIGVEGEPTWIFEINKSQLDIIRDAVNKQDYPDAEALLLMLSNDYIQPAPMINYIAF